MARLLLTLFLVFAPALFAQDAKLSESEQLRHALWQTQIALEQTLSQAASCRAQLRSVQLTHDEAQLKTDIEKAHGGYVFDPKTGQLAKPATVKGEGK